MQTALIFFLRIEDGGKEFNPISHEVWFKVIYVISNRTVFVIEGYLRSFILVEFPRISVYAYNMAVYF